MKRKILWLTGSLDCLYRYTLKGWQALKLTTCFGDMLGGGGGSAVSVLWLKTGVTAVKPRFLHRNSTSRRSRWLIIGCSNSLQLLGWALTVHLYPLCNRVSLRKTTEIRDFLIKSATLKLNSNFILVVKDLHSVLLYFMIFGTNVSSLTVIIYRYNHTFIGNKEDLVCPSKSI